MKRQISVICISCVLAIANISCGLLGKKSQKNENASEIETLPLEKKYDSEFLNNETRAFLNKIYFAELKRIKKSKDLDYHLDKNMIDYALFLKYESKASVSSVKGSRKKIKKYIKETFKQPVQLNFGLGRLASNLSVYSTAYMFKDKDLYKRAAEEVQSYAQNFLSSPEGYFYSRSEDGNSNENNRMAYVNENAAYADSLLKLYLIAKDTQYLERSTRVVDQMVANASLSAGGYKHELDASSKKITLLDSVNMARAFLSMYEITTDVDWLYMVRNAADYVLASNLKASSISERVFLLRSMNLFYHYLGKKEYKDYAISLMKPLLAGQIMPDASQAAALILADYELSKDPLHITIVAPKENKTGQELFEVALGYPSLYKRVEWFDHSQGDLLNHDIDYPQLPRAAAFVCVNKTCSMPSYDAESLSNMLEELGSQ